MLTNKLIETTIIPEDKSQLKISDGGGLYLLIKSSGKYWKLAYRFDGKQKSLSLGVYPRVGLNEAREKRDEAKNWLAAGTDPGDIKKKQKEGIAVSLPLSFNDPQPVVATPSPVEPVEAKQHRPKVNTQKQIQTYASAPSNAHSVASMPAMQHPLANISAARRMAMIQALSKLAGYTSDESNLLQTLLNSGESLSFDSLRTELAWLHEQQVIVLESDREPWQVTLTQSGLDAAMGRTWIPGIKK